ncbi:hypothetical protein ACS0TY_004403 [Phlomoides rotata]
MKSPPLGVSFGKFGSNRIPWNGSHLSLASTVDYAWNFHKDWLQLQLLRSPRPSVPSCSAWHCPPTGFLKLSVDAAFFEASVETGNKMVLRDEESVFLAAKLLVFSGCFEVDVGEAMGVYGGAFLG